MNEPPWIQTSTGRPAAPGSGVQTFRLRNSSPAMTSSGNSFWYCGGYSPLGEVGPYSLTCRVPDQGRTGCGGRIRSTPDIAAAYGTPRKECTPPAVRPCTAPAAVTTTGPWLVSLMCTSPRRRSSWPSLIDTLSQRARRCQSGRKRLQHIEPILDTGLVTNQVTDQADRPDKRIGRYHKDVYDGNPGTMTMAGRDPGGRAPAPGSLGLVQALVNTLSVG